MYLVLRLITVIEVASMGSAVEVPLSFAEGMAGTLPVFGTKEDAIAFAGDGFKIVEVAIPDTRSVGLL